MEIKSVEHVVVGGGKHLVCHWPRQGGLWAWNNELLAGYIESPCDYSEIEQVGHGQKGIWNKGYVRLRRSLDGGISWQDDGILFDNAQSVDDQRRTLRLDAYRSVNGQSVGPEREIMKMIEPDAILMMGRAWCGEESSTPEGFIERKNVAYCYRSTNRGKSWETVPSILSPHNTSTVVELANNTLKLDDGRLICWLVGYGGIEGVSGYQGQTYSPQLYASEDQGRSWYYYSEIYCEPFNRVAASYPQVIPLPSGRWLCTLGCWHQSAGTMNRWTALCYSDDEGLNWSSPRIIQPWSVSPFPLLLEDGRLLIVYMRRTPDPTGLYVIQSEDEGRSWSRPVCLRDDLPEAGPRGVVDGGYPLAIQLEDHGIFTAYYWQHDDPDVPWYGGRKYIGGTFFEV